MHVTAKQLIKKGHRWTNEQMNKRKKTQMYKIIDRVTFIHPDIGKELTDRIKAPNVRIYHMVGGTQI